MNITWIGVIMVICIMVIAWLLTYRSWPIAREMVDEARQKSRARWRKIAMIVSMVGLTITFLIVADFSKSEKVYLTRETRTETHLLLKMNNGEYNFFVLQNGSELQCNYINEYGKLTTQTLDSQMANGTFEADGHYLTEHIEVATYRYERGFFYGPTDVETQVAAYDLIIPIDGIFTID